MVRKLMSAVLLAVLALAVTACGSDGAGTSANRWSDAASQDWSSRQQADARGPIGEAADGGYQAGTDGRVSGFDQDKTRDTAKKDAETDAKDLGDDLKDAGEDLTDAAKKSAESIGNAAENALDQAKTDAEKAEAKQ